MLFNIPYQKPILLNFICSILAMMSNLILYTLSIDVALVGEGDFDDEVNKVTATHKNHHQAIKEFCLGLQDEELIGS